MASDLTCSENGRDDQKKKKCAKKRTRKKNERSRSKKGIMRGDGPLKEEEMGRENRKKAQNKISGQSVGPQWEKKQAGHKAAGKGLGKSLAAGGKKKMLNRR